MKKKKNKFGCFTLLLGGIVVFILIVKVVLYIPISVSHCSTNAEYTEGYCVFAEINDRYTVLNRQYFGRSGIFVMSGIIKTKPIYLFDKREKKIIKKGEIGWWVNSGDLETADNEIYFKNNYGGFVFSTYYTPSLKKPWVIRNDN